MSSEKDNGQEPAAKKGKFDASSVPTWNDDELDTSLADLPLEESLPLNEVVASTPKKEAVAQEGNECSKATSATEALSYFEGALITIDTRLATVRKITAELRTYMVKGRQCVRRLRCSRSLAILQRLTS